jgi:glycosyltransferase involved in cell wall biosynthesis
VIGIDGSRISGRLLTGTETYSLSILRELARTAEPGELRVYLNSALPPVNPIPGVDFCYLPARRLWTHFRLSREMRTDPPAVLFVPAHVVPVIHARSVVTVHDLAYLVVPEHFGTKERRELDAATRWNVRSADAIIAVSQRTKLDLIERYGVPPDRIAVVHHGVGDHFEQVTDAEASRVALQYGLSRPFILTVSTLHPRKNQENLIVAFERALEGGYDGDLLICGKVDRAARTLLRRIATSHARERIRLIGFASALDLPGLYSAARLYMLPSWYEGFGMTAIEAMASGTPVAVSSAGALPEVCGVAARYFAPDDVEAMTAAILESRDTDEMARRAHLGRLVARQYRWDRAGKVTLAILRSIRDGLPLDDTRLEWLQFAETSAGASRKTGS